MEIAAGKSAATPNATGVCAFRVPTEQATDPRAFRGWDGSAYEKRFLDPYTEDVSEETRCVPIVAGFKDNAHPQLRELAGARLRAKQQQEGWPTHLMFGWPAGGTKFAYAFPKPAAAAGDDAGGAGAFTL